MDTLPCDDGVPALFAAVVHELQQPIATASLAVDFTPPDLELVRSALARASGSCNVLAWLARSLGGDPEAALELQPRNLSETLQVLLRPAEDLQVGVPGNREVLAGPFALETVLHNLVRNARQHAPGSTVTVRARVVFRRLRSWPQMRLQGRALLLSVSDNGPGIPQLLKPRLFFPFARAGGQGLGIGLWLCRLLCRQHGGDLWLEETSSGASFCSLWPLVPARRGLALLSNEQRAAFASQAGKVAHAQGRAPPHKDADEPDSAL